jgi:predicted DCC family thiol-disulfide oxidoreductase YuxK
MKAERASRPPAGTLIYDGECRMCVIAKEGIERLGGDTDVRFIPYQSEEAASRLGSTYRPGRPDVAFFVGPDGQIHRGLDAFLPLLPDLPGARLLAWMLNIPVLRSMAYLLYRLVAHYRYQWFGAMRCEHCRPRS